MSAFQLPYFILCLQKPSFKYSDKVRFFVLLFRFSIKRMDSEKDKVSIQNVNNYCFDVGK